MPNQPNSADEQPGATVRRTTLLTGLAAAALALLSAGPAAAARIAMDGWSLQLPAGCKAQWQRIPATPLYDTQARKDLAADPLLSLKPDFSNMPEHLSIDLSTCYPGEGAFGTALRVLPVEPYLHIYDKSDDDNEPAQQEELARLQQWIAGDPQAMPDWPFLPFVDMHAQHSTQRKTLHFGPGGRGIRLLAQFIPDDGFAWADKFTYIFQGLSDDGTCFVLLTVPVGIDGLATDDAKKHLGFGDNDVFENRDSYRRYEKAVADLFDSGAARVRPIPAELDELILSLRRHAKARR
jgi:hypothetical protein